jgi:16S rRNA (adenine(1408)-N(1))-methyltransferase
VTIDVGTGDGRAVLATAARDPRVLVIGLDPEAASMAEASRRAARPARKGGLPNALLVAAAAEAIPAELGGIADSVTVRFPWASLLRGSLGADAEVAGGIAALVAPGGTLELLLAPAERDNLGGIPTEPAAVVAAARATFEALGLAFVEGRVATAAEIRASGSAWARRLLGGQDGGASRVDRRPVLVRFHNP